MVSKESRQLVMLIVSLVVMMGGCSTTDNATAKQQPPNSTASQTNSVAVNVTQDWVARHQAEDRMWADRTGLTPEQVRQLRLMADVPDDEAAYIVNLDMQNLKTRHYILLVIAGGNGHCLELVVFERKGGNFKHVWSTAEMPSGAGFCRESPINPEAYATSDGKLVVKIPVFDYVKNVAKEPAFYTYAWNGESYEFIGSISGA